VEKKKKKKKKKRFYIFEIFLKELFDYKKKKTITIYTDNIACKTNIEKDKVNTKLKHISIKYFLNKDNIEKENIKL